MSSTLGKGASFGGSPIPKLAGMDSDVNADINVTPMIDVMLVLLIIFMVITPALAGYQWTAPKALTAAPEKEKRVTLGIDKSGKYFVGEPPKQVNAAGLTEALKTQFASRPDDHTLYLKADKDVAYSIVLTAIDAAREAGVRRIGAITELPKGQRLKGGK
ncbi:MAG: Biopolymer transport protein ExbD/TolR [Gemmatimonadetes bacterium]|nr:Biopolymer transport protein ExbD/TolR [Gemmatimonadota bacterium]